MSFFFKSTAKDYGIRNLGRFYLRDRFFGGKKEIFTARFYVCKISGGGFARNPINKIALNFDEVILLRYPRAIRYNVISVLYFTKPFYVRLL